MSEKKKRWLVLKMELRASKYKQDALPCRLLKPRYAITAYARSSFAYDNEHSSIKSLREEANSRAQERLSC